MLLLCQTLFVFLSILYTSDAFRIIKHSPPGAPTRPLLVFQDSYLAAVAVVPTLLLYNQYLHLINKVVKLEEALEASNVVQCDSEEYAQLQQNYDRLEKAFNTSVGVIDSFGDDMKGSLEAYNHLYQSVNYRVDQMMDDEKKRSGFEVDLVKSVAVMVNELELTKGKFASLETTLQASVSMVEIQQINSTLTGLEEKIRNLAADKRSKAEDSEVHIDVDDNVNLYLKTVMELRALSRRRGLQVRGSKAELIARLS
jgi:small nuclear ribonucleoprotein (snRNP)-like protein